MIIVIIVHVKHAHSILLCYILSVWHWLKTTNPSKWGYLVIGVLCLLNWLPQRDWYIGGKGNKQGMNDAIALLMSAG